MTTTTAAGTTMDFTYCVARWDALQSFAFVVMTASKPQARRRAYTYAMGQRPEWGEPRDIDLYPRRYVREARALYAAGKHD